MKVSEWIAANPGAAPTVAPDASLAAIIEELLRRPGARDVYVVSEEGRVIGHLSHKRLIRSVLAEHHPWPTRRQLMDKVAGGPARELMNSHFPTASPDEKLDNVLHRQLEHDIEDLVVVDSDGVLLGAVSLTAVLEALRDANRRTRG